MSYSSIVGAMNPYGLGPRPLSLPALPPDALEGSVTVLSMSSHEASMVDPLDDAIEFFEQIAQKQISEVRSGGPGDIDGTMERRLQRLTWPDTYLCVFVGSTVACELTVLLQWHDT